MVRPTLWSAGCFRRAVPVATTIDGCNTLLERRAARGAV